jgi:hypothetical protein
LTLERELSFENFPNSDGAENIQQFILPTASLNILDLSGKLVSNAWNIRYVFLATPSSNLPRTGSTSRRKRTC